MDEYQFAKNQKALSQEIKRLQREVLRAHKLINKLNQRIKQLENSDKWQTSSKSS